MYLMILAVGCTCLSLSVAKTCPYDDKACLCYSDVVICENLRSLPPLKTGQDVTAVSYVAFNRGGITSLPDNSLPPNLAILKVTDHPLASISDKALEASLTTLDFLAIHNSQLTKLPSALMNVTKLVTLIITGTYIRTWDIDILQHIGSSVTILELRNVGLSIWPIWFPLFKSLDIVRFSMNPIRSVPSDAFKFADTLIELDLSECQLDKVPEALSTLVHIRYLNLSGNALAYANGSSGIELLGSFPFAFSLITLSINSLGLKVIPSFLAKSGSIEVDLSSNQITEIPSNAFSSSVVGIDISSNQITKITDTTFSNYSILDKLDLSSNPILTIDPSAFKDLIKLSKLTLDPINNTQIPVALTSIPSQILDIVMGRNSNCFCPAPPALVKWYKSFNGSLYFEYICSNVEGYNNYLSGPCKIISDDASNLVCSWYCRYCCLIMLLVARICSF